MTQIDFYTHCRDRLSVVGRLCAKAYRQGMRVRVLTADAAMTESLDRLLWCEPAIGFFPHCRMSHRLAEQTPIWIDEAREHRGPADVLLNLAASPPPFFARFQRLAEIVGDDDGELGAARERYRFYRERGYELRSHRLDHVQ